ncbi:MAG: SMI1/KNR4 family protein, partial [Dokdonella sp.]
VHGWSAPEPPATRGEIADAEKRFGRPLPHALIDVLLCSRSWLWRESTYDAVILLTPQDIALESLAPADADDELVVSKSLSDRVKPYCYSAQRIAFAYSDYCRFQIDEDPTARGMSGQVVVIDNDEETIDVVADSLGAFIEHGIDCVIAQAQGGYPNGQ